MNDSTKSINTTSLTHYCDALLLLTALDGGESILDSIADRGVGAVPFTERWDWRSRIHLPAGTWRAIEELIVWAFKPQVNSSAVRKNLEYSIEICTPLQLRLSDFQLERIDLLLDTQGDGEVIRAIRDTNADGKSLPTELELDITKLSDNLLVRIGQIAVSRSPRSIMQEFPRVPFRFSNQVMEQVYEIFNSPASGQRDNHTGRQIDLVVFPELAIPVAEISTFRQYVERTGRSSLAGLFWRELSPVYRDYSNTLPRRRWFVNEAEIVTSMNYDGPGPNFVRWYRVRKALPAHLEEGFAVALSSRVSGSSWEMLEGRRWYRFVHPKWGDFSVAICADLLDSTPWRSLRGELSHLFMVAYNKDIEFYQSLTWVRAYENYVNLVAVNHGEFGGSFIWTPRRSHAREVATLRGRDLFLFTDVDLPVKDLICAQRNGVVEAVKRAVKVWRCGIDDSSPYKSPPPGFSRSAT